MANKMHWEVQALQRETKLIYGRLNIGSSGAVDSVEGQGFTAARTAAGTYGIQLSEIYGDVFVLSLIHEDSAAADLVCQVQGITPSSGQVGFFTQTGGVATDPASGDVLHFCLACVNSSLRP